MRDRFVPSPLAVQVTDPANALGFHPPGFAPGQMEMLDGGTNWSGIIDELLPGQKKPLLMAKKRGSEGMIAVCTVHVFVREKALVAAPDVVTDQRLVLWIAYSSGRGGGDTIAVDCAQGAVISIPGTRSIEVQAELLQAPGLGTTSLTVEAVANWGTSVSPKPVYEVEPSIAFPGPFPAATDFLAVPQRAQRATLLADDNVGLANATLEFYRSNAAIARTIYTYRAPDPTRFVPVVAGARFYKVRYLGPSAINIIPCYELSL